MMSTSIRKVVFSSFGDASVIKIITADHPTPSKDEVQVDIFYSGFSGADINMRNGNYPLQKKAPLTPGYCFAGRVAANGPGASKFKVGDVVTAVTTYDSEAEKINVPEKFLVAVPDGVSMQTAAALILDWNTAYGMVTRGGKVKAGQRVFVHGLSGAVGYATMIISQMQGATVYGTASERNHARLRELGVHPFVYTDKDWMEQMKSIGSAHVVFDPLGFESYDESWDILSRTEPSLLVGFGGNKLALEGDNKSHSQFPQMVKLLAKNACIFGKRSTTFHYIDREQSTFKPEAEKLMELARQGKIVVPIKAIWDMDKIVEAHGSWGKTPGLGSALVRVRQE